MKQILACKCPGQDKKAKTAFKLMFPGEDVPEILIGKSQILRIAEDYPGTEIAAQVKAIARNKDKYAYYVEYDESGMVIGKYNLLTGVKSA